MVFVPEARDGSPRLHYDDQIDWESRRLKEADCILFWVPRDLQTMLALTTNVEYGKWHSSGKAVLGAPPEAPNNRYLFSIAAELGIPSVDTLADTVAAALDMVGEGAERTGGEREVPLHIWRTTSFQSWLKAQQKAGNRLDGADVIFAFRPSPQEEVFPWGMRVNVSVSGKDNPEWMILVSRGQDSVTVI